MSKGTLNNLIGGEWVPSSASATLPVINPTTGDKLADCPLGTHADVDAAVQAARGAFKTWRRVPAIERARVLFRFQALLGEHKEELAQICTTEHGKTLSESLGSVRRGIENVEHACGIPALMMGESLEDVARGIDCATFRQPLGVFAAVVPFNFPAMVPLWFWPYAIATGNTYIVKPSEQVPLTTMRMMELALEAGMPAGVLNMVHGGKDVVEALCDHPEIAGLSFVGSTPVARIVYERAAKTGKRVQSLGGAKNHIIVMPDAPTKRGVSVAIDSVFGCAGQRCLAGSVVVGVGDGYDKLRDGLVAAANEIVVGDGLKDGVGMGPVISAEAKARIVKAIDLAEREGGKILVDGRNKTVEGYEGGHWLGPTLIENVTADMTLAKEEVFGPVMALRKAKDLDEAIAMVHASQFANACSIVTDDGGAARQFKYEVGVSMLGINIGVAAPMAFFPFGGTKASLFGDLKAHGSDSIRFFTDTKVVISRWS
ncbi:MAG: CoA-acylating methylmalonate-semialdehyde dehydrogenase [Nannocystaceae bacterium]|nr:CoA-acylating methylmalonate-semialdehyde dehydrogenase [Nannocystaceae bacterium]